MLVTVLIELGMKNRGREQFWHLLEEQFFHFKMALEQLKSPLLSYKIVEVIC